jgi:NAD(P)-dependent dehydrogenase (short-subunit alcohol dehydrogenase family)
MGFLYDQLLLNLPLPTTPFTGRTVIVTGSNVGLGLEAARHFTRLNAAKVILAVRNTTAGESAKSSIEKSTNRQNVVEVWPLDLSSYASVLAFAQRCQTLPRLDVLLLNAAIATTKFSLAEGHETTLTVNVVSTFLLAALLLPKLAATRKECGMLTHCTIVSSGVHGWTSFKERDAESIFKVLDDQKTADMPDRYQLSKLLEVLVVRHIAPSVSKTYPGVMLSTTNPGLCHSALARDAGWFLWFLKLVFARSTEVGSRTIVAPAEAGEEAHGMYFSNSVVCDEEVSPFAKSEAGVEAGRKVWGELRELLEGVQKGVTGGLG